MIKVCDCVMGSGKTEASITYMNEHPDDKFIYITPFLEEAARIKKCCPALHFVEPSDGIAEFNFRKSEHTAYLIHKGKNIATTHQAFKRYTADMLDDIRKKGYRLIIDENVDILEEYDVHPDDIELALRAGYISEEDDTFHLIDGSYGGRALKEMFDFLRVRDLICIDEGQKGLRLYYWILPSDLITSFKDVFILTYLFEGQNLHHFLRINGLPYELIGVDKDENGKFRFCEYPGYTPEYIRHLGDMINILDSPKLNGIGEKRTALSMTWFNNGGEPVEELRRNIDNVVRHYWADVPGDKILWGGFKDQFNKLKGKGYTKSFLVFNAKATNEYRDRYCLVYVPNIFMNVGMKMFYKKNGIEVDEDLYALSVMVQWIWRSGIRDGEKINIYIPSKRMRDLLVRWIESVSERGDKVAEAE